MGLFFKRTRLPEIFSIDSVLMCGFPKNFRRTKWHHVLRFVPTSNGDGVTLEPITIGLVDFNKTIIINPNKIGIRYVPDELVIKHYTDTISNMYKKLNITDSNNDSEDDTQSFKHTQNTDYMQ